MYKVVRLTYNDDSWNRGDYREETFGVFDTLELAQQVLKYEKELDMYEYPEDYFTYESGYENIRYEIIDVSTIVFTSIEEYYASK